MLLLALLCLCLLLVLSPALKGLPIVKRIGSKRLIACVSLFLLLSFSVPSLMSAFLGGKAMSLDGRLLSLPVLAWTSFLLVVYFVSDGLRLFFVLKAMGYSVSAKGMTRLVFINMLFSNITPMATGGGFVQIWYLRRFGVPIGTATAATTVRTLLATVFIFLASPVVMVALDPFAGTGMGPQISLTLGLFALGYLLFFGLAVFKRRWMVFTVHRMLWFLVKIGVIDREKGHRWRLKSMREVLRFASDIRRSIAGGRYMALAVIFTVVFLMALFSFPFVLLRPLGSTVPYLTSLGLIVLTTFIMYFAPTPGGSGFAEGVFGAFFLSSVSSSNLVSVIIIWRFLTIYLGMIVGLVMGVAEVLQEGNSVDKKD